MKRSHLYVATIVVLAFATMASAQDVKSAIQKQADKFTAELKAGNAAAIAAMYTEDAMAFPPNGEILKGRADIQKFWQSMVDAKIQAELQILDVETHGNTATEVGTLVIKDASGKVIDRGKYVVTWKRTKSGWQLHRDIWNSSMPAPAH